MFAPLRPLKEALRVSVRRQLRLRRGALRQQGVNELSAVLDRFGDSHYPALGDAERRDLQRCIDFFPFYTNSLEDDSGRFAETSRCGAPDIPIKLSVHRWPGKGN